MIAHQLFRRLGVANLVRLSSTQTLNDNCLVTNPTAQTTSFDTLPVQETKDDDLYRYLWVRCRGHEVQVLDSYEKFLTMAAGHLEIDHVRTETPFRVIKRKTLLASRFVKKKYRVQYEVRTYNRDLLFKNLTGSTADTFLEYIERNLPDGVMLIAEKHRLAELPFDLNADDQAGEEKVESSQSK